MLSKQDKKTQFLYSFSLLKKTNFYPPPPDTSAEYSAKNTIFFFSCNQALYFPMHFLIRFLSTLLDVLACVVDHFSLLDLILHFFRWLDLICIQYYRNNATFYM